MFVQHRTVSRLILRLLTGRLVSVATWRALLHRLSALMRHHTFQRRVNLRLELL